ncbi:endonuclease/exonuclease/phosphatase family protein [Streptomyces sp. NA02950]|uniref:endonuclease/exonuclease/phosphatase family protein n=1 Tax=Streptomyces sp. NA02950 TaxID=2742137 RepID=UPI0015925355|nr:endonuclease/exonuclease/phosphatase family protein [Streptomyces sp. NA02950]QKV95317.1 endonuclease/exonuclease/phosphatase family protein [Streptomyces sp. NA02950]
MAQAYTQETDQPGGAPQRSGSKVAPLLDRLRNDRGIWRRGLVLAGIAVLLALVMIFHAQIPNDVGNLGSLLETFLPWLGLLIPVLLVLGLVRRSASAVLALVLPVAVWLNLFGGLMFFDKAGSGGDLSVVTHNVNADNPDPQGTADVLRTSGADVVALEELTGDAAPVYERALKNAYPYHAVRGTVGVWSKYRLSGTEPVDIKLGWTRALRTTVAAPQGEVGVYVAHLPSVRVRFNAGFTAGQRDASAEALGQAIADERLDRVVLLGDLNGTMNDRALAPVTSQMRSAQGAAGDGFGFSWPASFPMARIDQIMVRGLDPVGAWTMKETGSDHLPVSASVDF